eukprot:scaffold8241_cov171-Amphora_coffeaeformis.AAC.2
MFKPPLNRDINQLPFPTTLPMETSSLPFQGRAPLMNKVPIPTINLMSSKHFTRYRKTPKKKSPRRNSKGKDSDPNKPKRPLSAYNLFFQNERAILLRNLPVRAQGKPKRSHGKLGFVEMARIIGHKWQCADHSTKAFYDMLASNERERFDREMEEYKQKEKGTSTLLDRHTTESRTPSPISSSSSSIPSKAADLPVVIDVEPIIYTANEESTTVQLDNEMIQILLKSLR